MSGIRMMTDSSKLWRMQIWRKWLPFWAKREPIQPSTTVKARLSSLDWILEKVSWNNSL
uniref:Uncharacterized protein n=1 Tax=Laticauda laticaudata TaxID=8630 RepID=A0A8C5S9J5_LATLA